MNTQQAPQWPALLIVKDALERDLISLVVDRLGGQVWTVETEEAAREKAADVQPEVVILDLLAPGINSALLIKDLKSLAVPELKGLIVVSGLAYRDVVERARTAGATDFLLKPIDTDQLAARLEKIIAR